MSPVEVLANLAARGFLRVLKSMIVSASTLQDEASRRTQRGDRDFIARRETILSHTPEERVVDNRGNITRVASLSHPQRVPELVADDSRSEAVREAEHFHTIREVAEADSFARCRRVFCFIFNSIC